MRYHYVPIRMVETKTEKTKSHQGCGELDSHMLLTECEMVNYLGKQIGC